MPTLCNFVNRLGRRHEAVSAVLSLDHADARVGQVEANQPRTISGKPVEQPATRRRRLIRHVVRDRLPFRMLERNQRVGQDVAAHDQSVATGKLNRYVTLRVAGRIDDAQAGDYFIAGVEQADLVLIAA